MILTKIKHYLSEKKTASLFEMSQYFKIAPSALRPMLDLLINKGKVIQCETPPGCGKRCQKCTPGLTQVFAIV